MKNSFSTQTLRPVFASVLMALGIALSPVIGMHAALAQAPAAPAAPADTIRPDLIKILQPVQELLKTQNFKDALEKLAAADAIADKTPFEIYVTESLRGTAADSLGDYETSSKAFEKVFTTGKMPAANQLKIMQAMTERFYDKKDYPKTISWAKRYFEAGGTEPQIRKRLYLAYYFSDDLPNASKELELLVQADEKAGNKPAEEDLKNLAAMYNEQKNTAGYASNIEKLANLYPKKQYLANMIDLALKKPGYSNTLDLDVYRLQWATDNVSKASQYREYTQLAMQDGYALEARKVIDQGFASGLLGTGAEAAADKALRDKVTKRAIEDQKALAKDEKDVVKNKDGKGAVNVGLNYLATGQFDKSAELIEQGIAKGGLKNPNAAKLQLANAYLQGGKKDKAIEIFKSINGNDGSTELAKVWLIKVNQPG